MDNWRLVNLRFGHSWISVRIPISNLVSILTPRVGTAESDEAYTVYNALAKPLGTACLRDLVHRGQRVVIVTSDRTRPCPSKKMIPPVIAELAAAGVAETDITVVIALGLHHQLSDSQIESLIGGELFRRVRAINHDPNQTVRLGSTSYGTPVEIFKPVVEADFRICLGNVEYHYLAGYSGGAKAILPGCASEATVTANHAKMVLPGAEAGRLEGNPLRADLEEGAAMVGVDFVLNVVVDDDQQIVGAAAGDVIAAHRAGCQIVQERGCVTVPALADIVLVSAGGHPKDLNLYQAQKALDNAAHAVKPGGVIILVAECSEGFGNHTFETWMTRGDAPKQLLERIQDRFVLGGHKAAAIALVARKARLFLVSSTLTEIPLAGIEHYATLDSALGAAFEAMGVGAEVVVLPEGGSVLPDFLVSTQRDCPGRLPVCD